MALPCKSSKAWKVYKVNLSLFKYLYDLNFNQP